RPEAGWLSAKRLCLSFLFPEPRPARRVIDLVPACASKCARAGKLRIGWICAALEIDAQHVVFPSNYVRSRFHDRPSGDDFTFFHTNSVCMNPCVGVEEVGFV